MVGDSAGTMKTTESFITDLTQITSDPDSAFETKLESILELGCDRLGLRFGILAEIAGDQYRIVQVHPPDGVLQANQQFLLSDTFCEETIRSSGPIGFARTSGADRERHPAYRTYQLESYVGVAVMVDGRVFGTLNFTSREPRVEEFSEQEFTIVRLMGQWVGFELTRRRAEAALHEKDEQLERLLEAATRLNADLSLDRVLQQVADSARAVLDCRYAALGVLDEQGRGLAQFTASGMSEEVRAHIGHLPVGQGLLGLLIDDPRPIRMANLTEHPRSAGFPPHHPPMQSFLGVPILGSSGPIGNLYCADKNDEAEFTQEDENVAQRLAAEAAVAIQNARLVAELRKLQVTRDRFYAMVNHELRNALTGVYGWAELILRKSGPTPSRAVVETVESAERALELLNDLLDLSRLDATGALPEIHKVDARIIVEEAVATVAPSAHEADVDIAIVGPGALIGRTDAKRLRQILINLLRNAVRHSGGTTVRIEMSGDDDTLEFSVVDRGEGISPEQQAIIFDAFARADSKVGGGTGLGLTLSRRLAIMLGGDIAVQSKLGKGARFTLTIARNLPYARES